jgi:alpha-D-xyloside xylohydrolase
MKFTNGQWLVRDGFGVHCAAEARAIEAGRDIVTVYAPCKRIAHRGDTLGGPVLTVEYGSPMPDVIRVRAEHYRGRVGKGPEFALDAEDTEVEITRGGGIVALKSGKLRVAIKDNDGWSVAFDYGGRRLTAGSWQGLAWAKADDGKTWMRERLDLAAGECVYGLGERFTNFVKNGQSVDIWNRDGGTNTDQAYKNIPFYVTNRGYGVFVNHPGLVSFEVASESVSKAQFSVEGERLEYYIIGGETLKDVIRNYTALTGRPALPPAWSFGLWLSTSFVTDYNEKTVTGFVDGMAERGIPLHVFHFDCFWMKEHQWCDFLWDACTFPDPPGMLRRMKEKGLKICVWVNPYIAQKSALFAEGVEKGYLLHDIEGNVWQWDMWQPAMAIVDFTNPEAKLWYQQKLKALLDMGVDCFKTDFGERIPLDVVYHDGSDPARMHNYYTRLYNGAVFELLTRERGAGEALVFARSATVGCQSFPIHWGGDNAATYPSMAESLRGGLSLGLCGFGFWGHDIGGFEETATPDLYKRWAAFGLLSSHSRLHGNASYRVPWMFDAESVSVLRFFARLKCSLMPYLYGAACEAAEAGVPLMRPMVLEFCGDPAVDTLDRQYMLGENLLVAPVFSETGDVSYYLPGGVWTNVLTGKRVSGGRWLNEKHGYMSLPLMARPGSLIPFGNSDMKAEYDYANGAALHLFELSPGHAARARVRASGGKAELEVEIRREGDTITVHAQGAGKPWKLVLRGVHSAKGAEDARFEDGELGLTAAPEAFTGTFTIKL